ncbi:hypothetical protein E3P94_00783 [Wallemia ichthyophaga]|nr:hypothetical protein E3P95_00651 [Wallemia ichthyophaga]TIB04014.1 hypothetical protein E3P94_00783 [Wallemia ichthyophaga]
MSFNRLALAAALLEYDGTNKAKDSALFAPAPLTAKDGHNKYATFHGDSTDHPDHSDKSSAVDDPVNSINPIKSDIAKSVEAYRAGFNTPYPIHQQRELDENNKFDDVDLDSWGLDQFLVKSSSSDLPPPPPLRPQPGEARASKNRTLSDAANVSDIAAVAYHTSHSERARDDSSLANLNLFRDSSAVDIAREPQADSSDKEGRERAQSSLGFYRDAKSDFTLPPFEFTSKADPEIINSTTTEHRKSADSYRSDIPPHLRPSLPKEDNVKTVSRNTLLRPKTLIMPAPLQGSLDDINVHRDDIDFHHISTELKVPLPQALKRAREQKRHTALAMNRASVAVPLNSKSEHGVSFTNRNSRASVFAPSAANSHAQGPHVGSSAGLPTAQSEGEQAQLYDEELEDEYDMAMVRARKIREMDTSEMQPGTIFGSSLMDDIDSRKQAQKDKRRFFRGDERPQGSTADGRESSAPVITRMQSVFGVDELWQRDQAKAETLAAAEKADTERKQRLAVEKEQNRLLKKSNKKNLMSLKGSPSKQSLPQTPSVSVNDKENADATSESLDTGEVAPPQAVTPSMQNETVLGVSKWFNGSDSGSTHLPSGRPSIDHEPKQFLRPKRNEQWRHAPRKSIVPASSRAPDGSLPPVELLQSSQSIGPENSDEEDTMPISNIIRSRSQESDLRANIKVENDESEDERPLSTFIRPSRTPSEQVLMPKIQVELPGDSEREVQKEEDEDDVPLGLKHPQMNSHGQSRLEDDDDVALGSRPAAAAFQQRNSMYPAASRQSNMSFGYPGSTMSWNPAAMGGYPQMPMAGMSTMSMPMQMPPMGGFAPPYGVYPGMGMDPMMMAQMQAPSIPQLSAPDLQAPPHAQNIQEKQTKKINSIDQWRRDVQNYCKTLLITVMLRISRQAVGTTWRNARSYSSGLVEAFDHPSNPQPLKATTSGGLFKFPQLTSPESFKPISDRTIIYSSALVDRIVNAPSNGVSEMRKVVKNLDRLSDGLCRVIDLAELVRNVHPDVKWIEAADNTYDRLCEYMNELNTHVGLYQALRETVQNPAIHLDYSANQVALLFLRDFEKSGIHLSDASRRRFVELSSESLLLGRKFLMNQGQDSDVRRVTLSPADLMGIPAEFLRHLAPSDNKGNRILDAHGWEAQVLYRFAPSPEARVKIHVASNAASEEEVDTLEKLLESRAETAKLINYPTYSHVALSDKMVDDPNQVLVFLESLVNVNKPFAGGDVNKLLISAKESLGVPSIPPMKASDREFFMQMRASSIGESSSLEPLSPYLSLGNVMAGLSSVLEQLYGIKFVPRQVEAGEVWDPSVRRLDVYDTSSNAIVGTIYADLFARYPKQGTAAHYTVQCSRRVDDDDYVPGEEDRRESGSVIQNEDGRFQLPIVVLACTFDKPSANQPTLLSWQEVETIFHEMGHAIHSMIGRTEYQNCSGTRCATDFVEMPSILMEHILANPKIQSVVGKHWKTGKSLPPKLVEAHLAQLNALPALETHGQLLMALIDQAYHSQQAPLNGKLGWSTDMWYDVQSQHGVIPPIKDTAWQVQFGHLFGYGATYYSYLFDRALASKIYKDVLSPDPLSRDAGHRLREEVLRWGGGRDPWEMLADLLGGEDAELISKGGVDLSYANAAAFNAPPESEQVKPSNEFLEGQNNERAGLPDMDTKVNVVEHEYMDHPSTEGAQAAQAAQNRLQDEEKKTHREKHHSHSKPKPKTEKKVEKAEEAGLTCLQKVKNLAGDRKNQQIALSLINASLLSATGYLGFKNWNERWDRRVISAVSVTFLALATGQGYVYKK